MAQAFIAPLEDRGVVAVTGPDAVKFLNGLVTNEIAHLPEGMAAHAGLLSPQGKILFDFLVLRTAEGFLLDVARGKTGELVKRLGMYKLRANVTISDASERYGVWAAWGADDAAVRASEDCIVFRDPRHDAMGTRIVAPLATGDAPSVYRNDEHGSAEAYHAHRVAIGVPEGGKDYEFNDAYPHEADFDLFNGVSFAKGCYVGQEVVSRMQHKAVVRKRVVRIVAESALNPGSDITVKGIVIGRTSSVDGHSGLALIRLDRYAEAVKTHDDVLAGETRIRIREEDMARYTASISKR